MFNKNLKGNYTEILDDLATLADSTSLNGGEKVLVDAFIPFATDFLGRANRAKIQINGRSAGNTYLDEELGSYATDDVTFAFTGEEDEVVDEASITARLTDIQSIVTASGVGTLHDNLIRSVGNLGDVLVADKVRIGSLTAGTDYAVASLIDTDLVKLTTPPVPGPVAAFQVVRWLLTGQTAGALVSGVLTKAGAFTDAAVNDRVKISGVEYVIEAKASSNAVTLTDPPGDATVVFDVIKVVAIDLVGTLYDGVAYRVDAFAEAEVTDVVRVGSTEYAITALLGDDAAKLTTAPAAGAITFRVLRDEDNQAVDAEDISAADQDGFDVGEIQIDGRDIFDATLLASWNARSEDLGSSTLNISMRILS